MTQRQSSEVLLVGFFVLLLGSALSVSGCEEKHIQVDKEAALALLDAQAETARTFLEEKRRISEGRRISAKAGDADAQYELGTMYERGVSDEVEAAKWYSKAAEQGHVDAQCNLGIAYVLGEGVERNLVLSYMWLEIATMQGHELSEMYRGLYVKQMTKEQIAEAQKLAREWQESHSSGAVAN
jgi:TPR repeat protein